MKERLEIQDGHHRLWLAKTFFSFFSRSTTCIRYLSCWKFH